MTMPEIGGFISPETYFTRRTACEALSDGSFRHVRIFCRRKYVPGFIFQLVMKYCNVVNPSAGQIKWRAWVCEP